MIETYPLAATFEETFITFVRAVSEECDYGYQLRQNSAVRRGEEVDAGNLHMRKEDRVRDYIRQRVKRGRGEHLLLLLLLLLLFKERNMRIFICKGK